MSLADEIAAVDQLLQRVREGQVSRVDGTILATALELAYKCGIHLDDLTEIKLEDLNYDHNNEIKNITVLSKNTPAIIPDEVGRRLLDYLTYLRANNYPLTPKAQLFPGYKYGKKIERHLKKFSKEIGFKEIRNAGIKRHYDALIKNGERHEEAIKGTASQFKIGRKQVGDVIQDKIQPAGRPKPIETDKDKLIDFIGRAEWLNSNEEAKELIREFLDFINSLNIGCSREDKIEWINLFFKTIKDRLTQLEERTTEKQIEQKQEKKPLREVIRDFINSDMKHDDIKDSSKINLEDYYFPEHKSDKSIKNNGSRTDKGSDVADDDEL
jgi:hypothetical protein